MYSALQTKIVGKAIIIRHDNNEGAVDEIIATNYPNMAAEDISGVKAYIDSVRIDIEIYDSSEGGTS